MGSPRIRHTEAVEQQQHCWMPLFVPWQAARLAQSKLADACPTAMDMKGLDPSDAAAAAAAAKLLQ